MFWNNPILRPNVTGYPPTLRSYSTGEPHMVRFVHMVSSRDADVAGPVLIPGGAFSNKTTLAKALRYIGALQPGARLRSFRVEGDKVIAFPDRGIWHAIVLTPA